MSLVNVCPDIPDDWRGGITASAKLLGLSDDTVRKYAKLGRRNRGIDWMPSKSGRMMFSGKEIKRFWNEF